MKKIMILGALALTATQKAHAFNTDTQQLKLYVGAAKEFSQVLKPIAHASLITSSVLAGTSYFCFTSDHDFLFELDQEVIAPIMRGGIIFTLGAYALLAAIKLAEQQTL